ncbi:hypothetical protein Tco_0528001 [Tanacetum coccineum]
MSSSSKSLRDYSRKYQRAILEPWRQSLDLPPSPPSPPPNRTTLTSPISNNSFSSSSSLQNSTQNLNEIHHLSNLLHINVQQAIDATNPSPPTLPYIPPPSLDQVKQVTVMIERNVDMFDGLARNDIPEAIHKRGDKELSHVPIKTDEHDDTHIHALIAEELERIVSREIAKAHKVALPNLLGSINDTTNKPIQEEFRKTGAGETSPLPVTGPKVNIGLIESSDHSFYYNDFSSCAPSNFTREKNLVVCHCWIQDVEGSFATSKCPKDQRVLYAKLLRDRTKEW